VNAVSSASQSSVVGSPGVWKSFPLPSLMLKNAQEGSSIPTKASPTVVAFNFSNLQILGETNIRLWFGPGLAPGKVLFPRSSSDFSWREAMQKPERNRRAHRRQSAPRFDVTASRLDALKPGQPARFSF